MRSGNINLRAPEPGDLGLMYLYENNTDIWLYSETSRPFSKYTLEEYIKTAHDDIYATRQLRFVIEMAGDKQNKAIGFVDLYDFDPMHRRAGVGILIGDETERRKGYAGAALKLLAEYAFQTLNLHQLYCLIESSHQHSLKLFSNAGFGKSAELTDWLLKKGSWCPVVMMQLIAKAG